MTTIPHLSPLSPLPRLSSPLPSPSSPSMAIHLLLLEMGEHPHGPLLSSALEVHLPLPSRVVPTKLASLRSGRSKSEK